MFSVLSSSDENQRKRLGFFESRPVKNLNAIEGFHLLENMFYFFYKFIAFRLNKEKDDIQNE